MQKDRAKIKTLLREAILKRIDHLKVYFLAEVRARKNRNTIALEDVERELGLACRQERDERRGTRFSLRSSFQIIEHFDDATGNR